MRVMVLHNWYRSDALSGENRVVELESAALERRGHVVSVVGPSSDEIPAAGALGVARAAVNLVWSPSWARRVGEQAARFAPDVAHVHNTFPLLGADVLSALRDRAIPIVQTVHNYRQVCPVGTLYRDGTSCTKCVGRLVQWPSVRHRCYRGSASATAPIALSNLVHHRRWRSCPDVYLFLSAFHRQPFVDAGFPAERCHVKPNFTPDRGRRAGTGGHLVFIGRVGLEKGVPFLLEAWRRVPEAVKASLPLVVVGTGDLDDLVQSEAARDPTIRRMGSLPPDRCAELLRSARAAVVPSVWPEPFGLVVIEAMAAATPVLAPRHAGLAELVTHEANGLLHRPGDPSALAADIARLSADPLLSIELGNVGRTTFETTFAEAPVMARLEDVYERIRHRAA
jgi:glycosyltransferase involved in cell wall biosynthesis